MRRKFPGSGVEGSGRAGRDAPAMCHPRHQIPRLTLGMTIGSISHDRRFRRTEAQDRSGYTFGLRKLFCLPALTSLIAVAAIGCASSHPTAARPAVPASVTIPDTDVKEIRSRSGITYYAYVQLPPGYDKGKKYPVLFLTDAESYVFGMYTGIHFYLRAADEVREMLLVGIADGGTPEQHFQWRRRDYTPTRVDTWAHQEGYAGSGQAGEFHRFLREEFIPFIEQNYSTDPTRRGIWGSSYGGLLATYVLTHDPTLFSRYIISTPSLWWDKGAPIEFARRFVAEHDDVSAEVYLAVGTRETAAMRKGWGELRDLLQSRSWPSLKLTAEQLEGETHVTGIPVAFTRGLKATYGKPPISDPLVEIIATDGVDAAVRRYRQLMATDPDGYARGESVLNALGYTLLREKKLAEAIAILELNAEAFPRSANVYDSLGEAYLAAGDRQQAIANFRRALELNPGNASAKKHLERLESEH